MDIQNKINALFPKGISLLELIDDRNERTDFILKELQSPVPVLTITNSTNQITGEDQELLFISTQSTITNTDGVFLNRFILLDDTGKIDHQSIKQSFISYPTSGYLASFSIYNTLRIPSSLQLNYITDISKLELINNGIVYMGTDGTVQEQPNFTIQSLIGESMEFPEGFILDPLIGDFLYGREELFKLLFPY